MRIGLVTDFYYPWIAGPAILLRNLAHGLANRGHAVFLLAPSPTGKSFVEQEGTVQITRVRTIPSPFGFRLRVALPLSPESGRWMDEVRPDIVHIHHPFPLSASALFAARRRRIPVAATNHTIPECTLWGLRANRVAYVAADTVFSRWLLFLLRRANAVATPTATAALDLRNLGFTATVTEISNGVDSRRFCPGPRSSSLARRFNLVEDVPIVLYTGRLDAEKDMDTWLAAAALIFRRCPAQFVIGGEGADRDRLERRAMELGIGEATRFIGYVDDAELGDLYRLADVYCVTSPVELQSIATLEALASGLPVVGVRAGALPEIIIDNVTGWCVTPSDATAVSGGIRRLLGSADLRARLGAGGRELALAHDIDRTIESYERFLQFTAARRFGASRVERAAASGN